MCIIQGGTKVGLQVKIEFNFDDYHKDLKECEVTKVDQNKRQKTNGSNLYQWQGMIVCMPDNWNNAAHVVEL